MDESVNYIPDDLMKEIFLRLPVRSIGQCRCVSRDWLSFLTDRQFIDNHTIQNQAKHRDELKLVYLITLTKSIHIANPETYINLHIRKFEFDNISTTTTSTILLPWPRKHRSLKVGSSNGLICMKYPYKMVHEIFIIFNPLTRVLREVVYFSNRFSMTYFPLQCIRYGFGYDLSTQDYKIVKIICHKPSPSRLNTFVVNVFSLTNNSWRIIDKDDDTPQIPYLEPYPSIGQVGGVLHWKTSVENGIFTFDLATNKCGMLYGTLKDKDKGERAPDIDTAAVSVFQGCLCVTRRCEAGFNIWMMKEYGVKESWTKLINLELSPKLRVSLPRPICYANKGRLLVLQDRDKSILYNVEDASFQISRRSIWIYAYTESLNEPYRSRATMLQIQRQD